MSWSDLRRRWSFSLATLALRVRFFTGKASFVEAEVAATTNHAADVYDPPGKPPLRRVLAHCQLTTRSPRGGRQGWRLFHERAGGPLTLLGCGFCGHWFVIQVLSTVEPNPASCGGDWFSFTRPDLEGAARLFCVHCEQDGRPLVKFLSGRGRAG